MGMIICKKHGQQGIAINIQQEICEKILKNEPLQDNHLSVIKVIYYDNNELLLDMNYIVTKVFKKKLMLQDIYEITQENEEERLIKPLDLQMGIICGQCLNEYAFKTDIQNTLAEYQRHRTF